MRLTVFLCMGMMIAIGYTQLPDDESYFSEGVRQIESGYYSDYPESGEVHNVINEETDFSEQWKIVHAGQSPVPEIPTINFADRTVALIILDTKPTDGFAIGAIKVYESDNKTIIYYAEIVPGTDCMVTLAQTRPYTFISFPSKQNGSEKFLKKRQLSKIALNKL